MKYIIHYNVEHSFYIIAFFYLQYIIFHSTKSIYGNINYIKTFIIILLWIIVLLLIICNNYHIFLYVYLLTVKNKNFAKYMADIQFKNNQLKYNYIYKQIVLLDK